MAGGPQRRIAKVDCAIVNRFTMLSPVEMPLRACVDQVSGRDFGITNGRHHPRQFAPGVAGTFRRQISHIRQPVRRKGGSLGLSTAIAECPLQCPGSGLAKGTVAVAVAISQRTLMSGL